MLLVLMIAVAVLTITMLQVGMNYRRSILREREVEMIHRGVQYERAVRLYYRKNNSYPTSIEQLENTNKIRYLRKRYKDPMSPDGQWQIAHITDIKLSGFTLTGAAGAAGAAAAGTAGLTGAAANTALAAVGALQANSTNLSTAAQQTTDTTTTGTTAGQTTGTIGTGPADTNSASGNGAGPVLGGGPMLGVISKSKAEGIHSFNDKSHYNERYFIYDPSQDRGQQLTGPYNPTLTLGATTTTTTGTPAGQSGTTTNQAPPITAPPAPATPAP